MREIEDYCCFFRIEMDILVRAICFPVSCCVLQLHDSIAFGDLQWGFCDFHLIENELKRGQNTVFLKNFPF